MATLYGSIGRASVPRIDTTPSEKAADFLSKMAAYIPGEVISLFLVGRTIIGGNDSRIGIWGLICWLVALLARWFGTKGEGKIPNVILTFLAFPVWAMAIGGTILGFTLGEQNATLAVMVFTVLAGFIYNNK
jgi:hypothetical protein